MILDVWQIQELAARFSDVWQGKELAEGSVGAEGNWDGRLGARTEQLTVNTRYTTIVVTESQEKSEKRKLFTQCPTPRSMSLTRYFQAK
jgi:hypothetical protein